MGILGLIPGVHWIYGGIIAAILAGGAYEIHHLKAEGAAHELAALQISSAQLTKVAQEQVTKTATDYATTLAAIKDTDDAQLQAALSQHESDAQRLRDADAYRSGHPPLASSATGSGNAAEGTVSAPDSNDSFGQLEQVALGLADATRQAITALTACMADRTALVGK